jgi:hypothetical protein
MAGTEPKSSKRRRNSRLGSSSRSGQQAPCGLPGAAQPSGKRARGERSHGLEHRLPGAAFDADFEDADADGSAAGSRRDNEVSES